VTADWENGQPRQLPKQLRPEGISKAGVPMTDSLPINAVFWNRVLTVSEALEGAESSSDSLRQHLLALEEGFRDAFDPADDFQAYVTVALCRSIRRKLDGGLAPGG